MRKTIHLTFNYEDDLGYVISKNNISCVELYEIKESILEEIKIRISELQGNAE
jgi:hypothetical protein